MRSRLLALALTATLALGAALVPTGAAAAADPSHPISDRGVPHSGPGAPELPTPPSSGARSQAIAPEPLVAVTPPVNDDLANATKIASLPFSTVSAPYVGATLEPGEFGECRTTDPDYSEYFTEVVSSVWFAYTSTARQTLTFSGQIAGHSTNVISYEAAPIADLSRISCTDTEYRDENYLQAEAGKTYYFQVGDFYGSPVSDDQKVQLRIAASAPVFGTTPADALVLPSLPATVTSSTNKVDSNWVEPAYSCDGGDSVLMGSIWHRFVADVSGSVLIDLRDSYTDSVAVVWKSDGYAPTGAIGCSPIGPSMQFGGDPFVRANAKMSFTATAGATYFVQVGGDGWGGGEHVLKISNVGTLVAGTPVITGEVGVGKTLTASAGSWGPQPVTLSYRWNDPWGPIEGATKPTYVPTEANAGSEISVEVTGRKSGYADRAAASSPVLVPYLHFTSTPTPTVTGTVAVGQTLTAQPGVWTPTPDGFSYSWERNGEYIAYGQNYTLVDADRGTAVTAVVSGRRTGYGYVDRESAPVIVPAGLQTLMPTPTISGTTTVGSTLTANPGTWDAGTTLAYQWKKNGGTYISGATAPTYVLKSTDAGATLTVSVTSTKPGYSPATKTSATTAAVTGASTTAISGPTPTITGTVQVGKTVTANAGAWTPAPVTLAYQWKRNGVAISGATASTYTLVAADASTGLTVSVTGSKTGLTSVVKTSAAATVTPALLTLMPTPTISGTTKVGSTLTATPGTWDAGTTLSYQWKRNGGNYITGATKSTYVLTGSDAGATLTVSVTATKPGYSPATKTSATTAAVAAGTLTSATPTLTGTAAVGQTLTAAPGAWGPAPVTYAYQWKRGTTVISGATAATYTPVAGDVGASISVTVTGSKTGYTSVVKASAAKTVAKGTLTAPTPTVTGTAKVGSKLTAVPGTWGPAPVALTYQWFRAGTAIGGATAASYTPVAADQGKSVTVKVTGTKSGYTTATTTSAAKTIG